MPASSEPPRLTVVITAHQRGEFLRDAVESVLQQRSDALPFQIVVIKDFVESSLDSFLRDSGVLPLHPTERSLGSWVSGVMSHAAAPVLAFLDDDDLFLPGKLAAIDHQFHHEPRCGYYRNAIQKTTGRSLEPRPTPPHRSPGILWVDDGAKDRRTVEALWRAGASFNHSSIAVRREIVEGFRAELEDLADGYSTFLFYAALVSRYGVALDPRPWTLYRLHQRNESPLAGGPVNERWERTLRLAESRVHDADVILDLVRRRRPELWTRPLERVRARNAMYLSWTDPEANKTRRAQALAALLRAAGPGTLPIDLVNLTLGRMAVARRRRGSIEVAGDRSRPASQREPDRGPPDDPRTPPRGA